MLNTFPSLLTYSLIGPTLLRLLLGYFFIIFGWNKLVRKRDERAKLFEFIDLEQSRNISLFFGAVEAVVGLLLIAGAYTQIAALVAGVILLITVALERRQADLFSAPLEFYVALLVIAASLLLTGAGAYAFDIPL